ncbi:Protein esc1 [Lachnellula cervina]|uniref:Protein esc1 n=1 Tax=Lachnellula cervina TaxID=1316786 RepID=A0A7D8YRW1_9HELO|nr:Protein esc1 [Lachnellula cervina]
MDQTAPGHQLQQHPKPPTTISSMLNEPTVVREVSSADSAYASQNNSKHSSLSNPISHCEKTPSPVVHHMSTHALNSPVGAMSVASIVSPTVPEGHDQPPNNRLSVQTIDSALHNGSISINGDSRRESVDSRLGANFGDMRLGASPYTSNNQSTTSLQSSLAQQRNPGATERPVPGFRYSDGFSPRSSRFSERSDPLSPTKGILTSKTAPPIHGPTAREIAEAPNAIPGQAWALDYNTGPEENQEPSRQGTSFFNDDSRRNSFADSIASSAYTTESRLPQGQRRFDEQGEALNRLSRASSELQVSTHHHSLQHRHVSELSGDAGTSPGGSQPYSRTPELRVSHKLAERKRRTEMKDLFDQLRDLMPQERGSKASKWEILTKAISEYGRAMNDITRLSSRVRSLEAELETSRRESAALRLENSQLRQELAAFAGPHRPTHSSHSAQPPMSSEYPSMRANVYGSNAMDQNPRHENYVIRSAEQLPPIRNAINGHPQGPEAMSGVQYQTGFRAGPEHF